MGEQPAPAAIAIAAAAPRSAMREWMPTIIGLVTTAVMLGGFLIAIGGWRATVDWKLAELDRRLVKAEGNQEKYIPVLVGMTKDISFLADRARREDDERARDARR